MRYKEQSGINAMKWRVSLKLRSWNMNRFAMRAEVVKSFITHEKMDVLFVFEKLQRRWKSGIILPLKFEGSIISMPDHKPRKCGKPSIGIVFLSKQRGLFRKKSARDGKKWQMIEMRHKSIGLVGLYDYFSASAQVWNYFKVALKRISAKEGHMVIRRDLNASH